LNIGIIYRHCHYSRATHYIIIIEIRYKR